MCGDNVYAVISIVLCEQRHQLAELTLAFARLSILYVIDNPDVVD